jgi:endonuclease/exonuclease/phosphatase (EEP) superfamily protein YafD
MLLVLSVVLLLRLAGAERGTLLTLLVGALPLTLLPAYAVLAVAAALRQRLLAAGAAVVVLGHLLLVAPALGAAELPAQAEQAPRLRVVTANLLVLNPEPERAGAVLRSLRPDVLVVSELSPGGLAGLRASGLLDDLPHSVARLEGRPETVGLFSRLPLEDVELRSAAFRELPRATVRVSGTPIRLLPAHPLPPVWVLEGLWRASLGDLRAEVRGLDLPLVVAGDLNGDRDHAAFRRLLDTGLRDAHDERGRGIVRTWPAAAPLLHLDHVLVRDGAAARLGVLDVQEVVLPGTDHRAVVADLAVLATPR